MRTTRVMVLLAILIGVFSLHAGAAGAISVDTSGYDVACGVVMRSRASQILFQWPGIYRNGVDQITGVV